MLVISKLPLFLVKGVPFFVSLTSTFSADESDYPLESDDEDTPPRGALEEKMVG